MAKITKEFLEEALDAKISHFEVYPGSQDGDGYCSILYAIDVTLLTRKDKLKSKVINGEIQSNNDLVVPFTMKTKTTNNNNLNSQIPAHLHLLLKCYPENPARQVHLTKSNVFRKELLIYNTFIPELDRFIQENSKPDILLDHNENENYKEENGHNEKQSKYAPPFPQFFYGRAIDYDNLKEGESSICLNPLDNFILMTDLRKTGDFKLADRLTGLNYDHCNIVITAHAKLHAISWVYKVKMDIPSLAKKYDFLGTSLFDELDDAVMEQVTEHNLTLFRNAVMDAVNMEKERKQELSECLERFKKINAAVTSLYFCAKPPRDPTLNKDNVLRVPQGDSVEDEEAWLVLTHGDAWLNNMMFRYDDLTGKPLEVIFVDLQITREGDPLADLVYTLYTSTPAEIRKQHLIDLLKLYTDTFLQVCEKFNVPPLPGFDLKEVNRRFHRARAFGFSMSILGLPIFLTQQNNVADMDNQDGEGADALRAKQFNEMAQAIRNNSIFAERALGIVEELYDDGVI